MTGLPTSQSLRAPTAPATTGAVLRAKGVHCPRCGYDQRGEIESWSDRCPVESVCTECGFTLPWREILGSCKPPPRWSFEHSARLRFPLATVASVVRAHRPGRYWMAIKPWHDVRCARLIFFIVALVLAVWLVFSLVQALWAVMPVVQTAPPLTVSATPQEVVLRVLLNPLSNEPPAVRSDPARPGVLYWVTPPGMIADQLWLGPAMFVGWLVLAIAFSACSFAALPQSRRKAKVRWAHIARIAVHCMAFPFVLMMLAAFQSAVLGTLGTGGVLTSALLNAPIGIYVIAVLPLLVASWSFASGRYLRMDHPWGIGAAVVTIGVLATMLLLAVALPGDVLAAAFVIGP